MNSGLLADGRWRGPHGIGRFAAEVLRRLPAHGELAGGPRVLSPLDAPWRAWQILARRPRVFFSPGFNPPPVCPAELVFVLHDLLQVEMPGVATPATRAYYAAIVRPACRRAFRVLTVSEFSRSRILAWAGIPEERVVNVGNGAGYEFSCVGDRHQPGYGYIFYAGNFRPHKNVDRLLAAFRALRDSNLVLVMTGPCDAAMAARVARHGVPARTRFTGIVSDAQLAAFYRGAELVVVPSLAEGFGLPALEAMACGTPVVASNTTALPEVTGDAALLVDPYDTGNIRQAIERVLYDRSLRASLRAAGLERARRFTWDAVAGRVQSVLQQAGWEPQKDQSRLT